MLVGVGTTVGQGHASVAQHPAKTALAPVCAQVAHPYITTQALTQPPTDVFHPAQPAHMQTLQPLHVKLVV